MSVLSIFTQNQLQLVNLDLAVSIAQSHWMTYCVVEMRRILYSVIQGWVLMNVITMKMQE